MGRGPDASDSLLLPAAEVLPVAVRVGVAFDRVEVAGEELAVTGVVVGLQAASVLEADGVKHPRFKSRFYCIP